MLTLHQASRSKPPLPTSPPTIVNMIRFLQFILRQIPLSPLSESAPVYQTLSYRPVSARPETTLLKRLPNTVHRCLPESVQSIRQVHKIIYTRIAEAIQANLIISKTPFMALSLCSATMHTHHRCQPMLACHIQSTSHPRPMAIKTPSYSRRAKKYNADSSYIRVTASPTNKTLANVRPMHIRREKIIKPQFCSRHNALLLVLRGTPKTLVATRVEVRFCHFLFFDNAARSYSESLPNSPKL